MTAITHTAASSINDFNIFSGNALAFVGRLLGAVARAHAAGREFEMLNGRTDAQLARDGISRDQVARAIFDRHFA